MAAMVGAGWRGAGDGVFERLVAAGERVRPWVDVRVSAEGDATLSFGDFSLSARGAPDDEAAISVVTRTGGGETAVTYRLRPDTGRWTSDADERERFAAEFAGVPGWRERSVRLAIDILDGEARGWIDGRFVGAGVTAASRSVRLDAARGAEVLATGADPLPESRFVAVDIGPFGGSDDRRKLRELNGIPFHVSDEPRLDVGRTQYRGQQPYIHCTALDSDPARALVRIPTQQYDRVHLLCSIDPDRTKEPAAAVRFIWTGRGHSVVSGFTVPKTAAKPVVVTVPLDPCAFQDFIADPANTALDVDFSRPPALSDNRFPEPAGAPSAVRIHAITFETAPVEMLVESDRTGHLFEAPELPRFTVRVRNLRGELRHAALSVVVASPYGGHRTIGRSVALQAGDASEEVFELPQERFGRYGLRVVLETEDGARRLTRETTFGVLPPDTRRATLDDSPFGVWCFFEGHHGIDPEKAASLFRLSGAKGTLANFLLNGKPEHDRPRRATLAKVHAGPVCANVACIANTCNDGKADVETMMERMRSLMPVKNWLVFWETAVSREQVHGIPPDLLGGPARPLAPEEEKVFTTLWDTALAYATRAKQEFPDARLVYGNGHPAFIGTLLERGFPSELIDGFGLDFDSYRSMPELQPSPLHCTFADLYFLTRFQELYGYAEKPRYLTEALYSSQAEGWLTEREQADYYIRAHLLGLASGVVLFGMTTELWDPGTDYHYGHYGPVGLCRRPPELNPRESFVAYSTMTRVLDGARFDAMVETPSPSAFILRFEREQGGPVFSCWTVQGRRIATAKVDGADSPRVTDQHGNTFALTEQDGTISFGIETSPVYVEGIERFSDITFGEPRHEAIPDGCEAVLVPGAAGALNETGEIDAWFGRIIAEHGGSIPAPYRHGGLALTNVDDPARGPLLRVEVAEETGVHPLTVRYRRYGCATPVALAPDQRALAVLVRGNSSWGRVVFEIEDAGKRVWRSIRQYGFVDHDGWRWIETPLPWPRERGGIDPAVREHWVSDEFSGEPEPSYRLTGLLIEGRTHVIRATDLVSVPDRTFDIGKVVALR